MSAPAHRPDKKNAYYCEACKGYVVTIDRDEGVTPMFLACRVLGEPTDPANTCKGQSHSLMYPTEPWPEKDGYGQPIPTEPTYEWYKPDDAEAVRLDAASFDHVSKGGLMLRKIEVSDAQ